MAAMELKVNLLHALEDFLGMYEQQPSEVVLVESIANSIDIGATQLSIYLDDHVNTYKLVDNGKGMDSSTFENYHTIALSSKDKSKGIGFAGVGAKIYLASWEGASVITETFGKDGPLKSVMYREGNKLLYKKETPTITSQGTSYMVTLSPDDFKELEDKIADYIRYWYNWNLIKGLKILVNDMEIKPWKPKLTVEENEIFEINKHRFPFHIWLADEELPNDMLNVLYLAYGKRVKREIPDFFWDVKMEYKDRLICIVEADEISDLLTSNKEDFRKTPLRNQVFTEARMRLYIWAKENNLLQESEPVDEERQIIEIDITKELNKILELPEFSWINPWSEGFKGTTTIKDPKGEKAIEEGGGGQNTTGTKGGRDSGNGVKTAGPNDGPGYFEKEHGNMKGTEVIRKRKGLAIIPMDMEEDPRESWVDVVNQAVVLNLAHPLARKVERTKDRRLLRYNIARVIVSALIQHAESNAAEPRTATEMFKIQSELLTKLFTESGSNLTL